MTADNTHEEDRRRLDALEREVIAHRSREAEILKAKEFLQAVSDSLQGALFVLNEEGELVQWNRRLIELAGRGPGKFSAADALHLFAEEDREAVSRGMAEAFTSGTFSLEASLKTAEGKNTCLCLTGSRFALEGKRFLSVLGMDTTDFKQAERALRESEERFRFLAENTDDVLYRLRYDSMDYDYLSPSIEKATGYSSGEIRSLGFSKLVIQIEMPGRGVVPCNLVAEDRRQGKVGEFQADYLIRAKTGDLRWLRDHSFPWIDEKGQVIGSVGILAEITERKQGEQRLRESEERFRQMFEKSLAVMLLIDPDSGDIVEANDAACRFYGYEAGQLKAMNMSAVNRLARSEIQAKTAEVFAEKQNFFHFRHNLASGEIREVEVYSSPLEFRGRRLLHSIIHDITDRKRAEEALRESEQRLRLLSSRLLTVQEQERTQLARELHNSIGQTFVAVKLALESSLVMAGSDGLEAVEKSLRKMILMAQNAVDEVRRIYMNLRPTVLDDFGITAAIGWLRREFERQNPRCKIELEITIEESDVPDRIKPVVFRTTQDAMENVARHSRADFVHLSLVKANGGVMLTVADRGVGFSQESALAVRRRGIGLARMKERVEISGGSFAVESVPGEGTVVRAMWPPGGC